MIFLYPYKKGSKSANDLSKALGIKQIKLDNSNFKGGPDKIVINWGRSVMNDEVAKCTVLNNPEAVALASDKLAFFKKVAGYNKDVANGIRIPPFMTTQHDAMRYVAAGYAVVARTVLNGHSGAGIVICETLEEVADNPAKLYVMYIKKTREYRVHVFRGEVVDVQRKARDRGVPDDKVDWKVRNHKNGFIYSRDVGDKPVSARGLSDCVRAVELCGLDFGAVDIIHNQAENKDYILEINTAPGLVGQTLEGYRQRFSML